MSVSVWRQLGENSWQGVWIHIPYVTEPEPFIRPPPPPNRVKKLRPVYYKKEKVIRKLSRRKRKYNIHQPKN